MAGGIEAALSGIAGGGMAGGMAGVGAAAVRIAFAGATVPCLLSLMSGFISGLLKTLGIVRARPMPPRTPPRPLASLAAGGAVITN